MGLVVSPAHQGVFTVILSESSQMTQVRKRGAVTIKTPAMVGWSAKNFRHQFGERS